MTGHATIPARLDPQRNPNGQFRRGNNAALAHNSEMHEKYRALQSLWFGATCETDMKMVIEEIKNCITQTQNYDVKLKAAIFFVERCLGRTVDRVAVDIHSESHTYPILDLSAQEAEVLERVVSRSVTPAIQDAEVVS